ncbi:MAG: TetR/AcrR family transcriptional regulator [Alphaproteobacteria bacterium]
MSTRDRIIGAAMNLFWEKGYGATSIADLLKAAEVNSGSLYHFFPGKQDVLIAVLEAYRTGIGEMLLAPAWEGVEDPVERVFALLAAYRGMIVASDCMYGCPIGSIALELHEPDPPVRELLAVNFTGWTEAIRGCLEAAGDRIPAGVDLQALSEFVLCTMEGGIMQARTHRDVGYFDRAVAQLKSHFDLLAQSAQKQGEAA